MKLLILLMLPVISFAQTVSILEFEETEPNNTPNTSRMLFADSMLRIDDGKDESGYVLYDSSQNKIMSISHQDKTIFVIKNPEKTKQKDERINFTKDQEVDEKAPKIQGKRPLKITFYNGMKKCGGINAVNGLFGTQLSLLKKYYQTMQLDAQASLYKTPKEFREGCYMNNFIYHLNDYYENGFPIVVWRTDGYLRILKSFQENIKVDDKLFELPSGYRSYSVN